MAVGGTAMLVGWLLVDFEREGQELDTQNELLEPCGEHNKLQYQTLDLLLQVQC